MGTRRTPSGSVHPDVDGAKGGLDLRGGILYGISVGHLGGNGHTAHTEAVHLTPRGLQPLDAPGQHTHVASLRAKASAAARPAPALPPVIAATVPGFVPGSRPYLSTSSSISGTATIADARTE